MKQMIDTVSWGRSCSSLTCLQMMRRIEMALYVGNKFRMFVES